MKYSDEQAFFSKEECTELLHSKLPSHFEALQASSYNEDVVSNTSMGHDWDLDSPDDIFSGDEHQNGSEDDENLTSSVV
jgi:hypothetical protein